MVPKFDEFPMLGMQQGVPLFARWKNRPRRRPRHACLYCWRKRHVEQSLKIQRYQL